MEREKELGDLEEQPENCQVFRSHARKALTTVFKNLKQVSEATYMLTVGHC